MSGMKKIVSKALTAIIMACMLILAGCSEEETMEPYTIKVTGIITEETFSTIRQKVDDLENHYQLTIDMSEAIVDKVTAIPDYWLSGFFDEEVNNLLRINLPVGITAIGREAFCGCTGLKSINIPDSVIEIGAGAFRSCTSLSEITIPDSVTEIGDSAF